MFSNICLIITAKSYLSIICCLFSYNRPELVDFSSLKPTDRKANLERAFSIAETKLGVDRLIDAEGKECKTKWPTLWVL